VNIKLFVYFITYPWAIKYGLWAGCKKLILNSIVIAEWDEFVITVHAAKPAATSPKVEIIPRWNTP